MPKNTFILLSVAAAFVLGGIFGAKVVAQHPTFLRLTKTSSPAPSKVNAALEKIAHQSSSPQAWADAADAMRTAGDLAGAEAAFRAALSLDAADPALRAQLGYTLLERGRDLEAWAQLEEAKAKGQKTAMLDFTLKNLGTRIETSGAFPRFVAPATPPPKVASRRSPLPEPDAIPTEPESVDDKPAPPPIAQPEPEPEPEPEVDEPDPPSPPTPVAPSEPLGPCEVAATPMRGRGTYLVDVELDGVETKLILDTGATLTVVSSAFADDANIRAEPGRSIGARTAGGFVRFETAVVGSIDIAGRSVENVRVAICDDCTAALASGLLGLDVQRPLGLALDVRRHVVRFADCVE